jgi:hypothetical protein
MDLSTVALSRMTLGNKKIHFYLLLCLIIDILARFILLLINLILLSFIIQHFAMLNVMLPHVVKLSFFCM